MAAASASSADQVSATCGDDGVGMSLDMEINWGSGPGVGGPARGGDEATTELSDTLGSPDQLATVPVELRLGNLRSQFEKYCQHMEQLEGPTDGYTNEYMHLAFIERNEPRVLVQITKTTQFKNRYLDIIPVESTNVSIGTAEETRKGVSYINANFVCLWTDTQYIATQGPLPNTVVDFWRLVWLQNSQLIVMLTNLVERGLEKCHLYWPEFGESIEAGPFRVHYTDRNRQPDFTMRTLVITHIESGISRSVTQAHFTSWPDQGVPLPGPFAEFCDVVNATLATAPRAPVIVHCSAGVGRSGVYIACQDILEHMQIYLRDGVQRMPFLFDVKGTVRKMRTQRPFMVQNRDQYVFLYSYIKARVARVLGLGS
eukprot:Amastigsp_a829_324.p1 type:complete len:371 gc:universal Amastigsp_a829_324:1155-43(-)